MTKPLNKWTPAHVPALLAAWLILVIAMTASCQPGEKPSLYDSLTEAETLLTAGAQTLSDALAVGVLTVDSAEYAQIYTGLERANVILDNAWAAYNAGDNATAEQGRTLALTAYGSVRPLLVRLAGESP